MIVSKMKTVANKTADGITMGYIKTQGFLNSALERKTERGDIVQTIIIIAVFVGLAVVVFGLVGNSLKTSATNVSKCITNATGAKIIAGTNAAC